MKNDRSTSSTIVNTGLLLGIIMALGVYNRATFIIFTLMPFIIWLCSSDFFNMKDLFEKCAPKIISTMFSGLVTSLILSLIDTYFYREMTFQDLLQRLSEKGIYQVLLKDLVTVPLNFIAYNVQPTNLAEHGIHPRITHFFGNTTLLFNVLAFFPLIHSFKIFKKRIGSRKKYEMPTVGEKLLLIYFIPILLLSIFPHQEPRFLIPLLPLLCFLYGQQLFGSQISSSFKTRNIWIILNLLCTLFFGQIHQGGVIQALEHAKSQNLSGTMFFWKTYMPPRHLLFQNNENPQLKIIDLMGSSQEFANTQLNKLLEKNSVSLATPSNIEMKFCTENIDCQIKENFFPHLTMENLPNLLSLWENCNQNRIKFSQEFWNCLKDGFSLTIYNLSKK